MSNMSISGMKKPQVSPPTTKPPGGQPKAPPAPNLSDMYSQVAQKAMKPKTH